MNSLIKVALYAILALQFLNAPAATTPPAKSKLTTETTSDARKFFTKLKQISSLSKRITDKLAPEKLTSAQHIVLLINNLADLSLLIVDMSEGKKIKVADTSVDFDKLGKRLDCLLKKTDAELKKEFETKKDATCPTMGCTSAENCFLLIFRDTVYASQLFLDSVAGKLVQTKDKYGKTETTFEVGLLIEAIEVLLPIIKFLASKVPSPTMRAQIDKMIAKFQGSEGEKDSGAKGLAIQVQTALAPVGPAIDFVVVGLGDDLDAYIDLPEVMKETIKVSQKDEEFGDFADADALVDEVRSDFKDFEGFENL